MCPKVREGMGEKKRLKIGYGEVEENGRMVKSFAKCFNYIFLFQMQGNFKIIVSLVEKHQWNNKNRKFNQDGNSLTKL